MNKETKVWASNVFNRREEQVELLFRYFNNLEHYLTLELALKNLFVFKVPTKTEAVELIYKYEQMTDQNKWFRLPTVHKNDFFYTK